MCFIPKQHTTLTLLHSRMTTVGWLVQQTWQKTGKLWLVSKISSIIILSLEHPVKCWNRQSGWKGTPSLFKNGQIKYTICAWHDRYYYWGKVTKYQKRNDTSDYLLWTLEKFINNGTKWCFFLSSALHLCHQSVLYLWEEWSEREEGEVVYIETCTAVSEGKTKKEGCTCSHARSCYLKLLQWLT